MIDSLRPLVSLAVLSLLAGVAGCASVTPITELVVVVQADVPVTSLHVTVTGPDGDLRVDEHLASPTFPVSLVMTRDRAPYGPVAVHVDGADIASDSVTELVAGERRRLDVTLASSCRCASCTAAQTCRGGGCEDRHVAGTTLPLWIAGTDASLGVRPHDAGSLDTGPHADAGPGQPSCGCAGQPCCAGTCASTYSCRMGTCRDCITTDPTLTGMTPASMRLTAVSATGDTLWISVSDGTSIAQQPLALTGGLSAMGTAPITQVVGMSATGGTITVRGPGTASGTITIMGATVSGSFTAPMRPDGTEGWIASVVASGHTLTLTAWDGSHGVLTFAGTESCR